MKAVWLKLRTLWKKELLDLCIAPATFTAILIFLLGAGIPFLLPINTISAVNYTFADYVSRLPFLAILIFPSLTMSSWADERRNGTEAILFSLPVSDTVLVLGKFLARLSVFSFMLVLTLPVLFTVPFDSGAVFSTYFLFFLYGAATLSLGQFLSSLFSSPVMSFLVTASVLLLLNTSQLLPLILELPQWAVLVCTQMSFAWHFEAAARGILDSRDILFYLFPTLAFLQANRLQLVQRRIRP